MRTIVAALLVLAAALVAAPPAPAMSAPAGHADRVGPAVRTARIARVSVRDQVIELTNEIRVARGCDPLSKNAALSKSAQRHTKRMANAGRGGTLSHQLPGEASLGTRVTRAGYRGWTLIGENVANGSATPAAVLRAWMHSRPHRRNILKCRYQDLGVGYAVSANGTPYWTQDFGRN